MSGGIHWRARKAEESRRFSHIPSWRSAWDREPLRFYPHVPPQLLTAVFLAAASYQVEKVYLRGSILVGDEEKQTEQEEVNPSEHKTHGPGEPCALPMAPSERTVYTFVRRRTQVCSLVRGILLLFPGLDVDAASSALVVCLAQIKSCGQATAPAMRTRSSVNEEPYCASRVAT